MTVQPEPARRYPVNYALLNTVLLLVAIVLLVLIMCGVGVVANPNVW